jgi:hypothetical protein
MKRLDDYLRERWFSHGERDPGQAASDWLTKALASKQAAELILPLIRERASHTFRTYQRATYERGNEPSESRGRYSFQQSAHAGHDSQRTDGAPIITKVQQWLSEEVWVPEEGMKPWRNITAADLKHREEWLKATMAGMRKSIRFVQALSRALERNNVDTVGELPESALPKEVRAGGMGN